MYKDKITKLVEIFQHSQLSISKFSKIIEKDRRIVTSWIDKKTYKEPDKKTLEKISSFFRYPIEIWNTSCQDDEYNSLLKEIPKNEIKIIDDNYVNRLKYILKHESKGRLVIHSQFPGPVYRDTVISNIYKIETNKDIEQLKSKRMQTMLIHSFKSEEWYSIKSILNFCFSEIGNAYNKDKRIKILDLMKITFDKNYNKHLYLFDSFSTKIHGLDTTYMSININDGIMFLKAPIESVFIEISNKALVERINLHFTSGIEAPKHVEPKDSIIILDILKNSLIYNFDLITTYNKINQMTSYGNLFKNNINFE